MTFNNNCSAVEKPQKFALYTRYRHSSRLISSPQSRLSGEHKKKTQKNIRKLCSKAIIIQYTCWHVGCFVWFKYSGAVCKLWQLLIVYCIFASSQIVTSILTWSHKTINLCTKHDVCEAYLWQNVGVSRITIKSYIWLDNRSHCRFRCCAADWLLITRRLKHKADTQLAATVQCGAMTYAVRVMVIIISERIAFRCFQAPEESR